MGMPEQPIGQLTNRRKAEETEAQEAREGDPSGVERRGDASELAPLREQDEVSGNVRHHGEEHGFPDPAMPNIELYAYCDQLGSCNSGGAAHLFVTHPKEEPE